MATAYSEVLEFLCVLEHEEESLYVCSEMFDFNDEGSFCFVGELGDV